MNIKKYLSIVILLVTTAVFTACDEDSFLSEEARSVLTVQDLYSTQDGFETAINAIYSKIRDMERGAVAGAAGEATMGRLMAASTDNVYFPIVRNQELPWVQWGEYSNSTLQIYEGFFDACYSVIGASNVIISRIQVDNLDIDQDVKNEILAQAYFFRAWSYRHLTYCFGDVPLITDEITGDSFRSDWERTPKAQVYSQMESDYLFAEANLPDVQSLGGRISSATVQHFLAELYLVLGDTDLAEQKAQAAVDNPNFKLVTERYGVKVSQPGVPMMDMFYDGNVLYSEGNTEGLWNFLYNKNVQGGGINSMRRGWLLWYWRISGIELSVETGGRGAGWYGLTKYAIDLYDEQDDRGSEYALWRYMIKTNGDTLFITTDPDGYIGQYNIGDFPPTTPDRPYNWPSTRKWDDAYEEDLTDSRGYKDQPYLRLAETYLLLAEAQHLQGKNELAAENLNIIRRRSNASDISASDVSIDFILEERSRELVAEEQRRYTLLRLGVWMERTKEYNAQSGPYITGRDKLYPIPQSVIDSNLDLEFPQNPGY